MSTPPTPWIPGPLGLASLATAAVAATSAGLQGPPPAVAAASPAPVAQPVALAWGDVDGDGLHDVLVVDASARARLLLSFGEGRFEDVTLASGLGEAPGATCALFADLDGDGRDDLFLGSSETRVWRNLGDGLFAPMASGIDHDLVDLAANAADRDGDGRVDLEVRTEAGELVYRNLGEGLFERLDLPHTLGGPIAWVTPATTRSSDAGSADDVDSADDTPADRRLRRWRAGSGSPGLTSSASSAAAATPVGPYAPLGAGLACAVAVDDAASSACLGASSVPEIGKLHPLSLDFNVSSTTGFVGMGITDPQRPLHVRNLTNGVIRVDRANTAAVVEYNRYPDSDFGSSPLETWQTGANDSGYWIFDKKRNVARMQIDASGKVGIGTLTPSNKLDVTGGGFSVNNPGGTNSGHRVSISTPISGNNIGVSLTRGDGAGGADRRWDLYVPSGNSFRIRDGNANADRLTIDTAGLVSVKQTLEIRGGADIVERFESSCGELEPGTVVAIDPESPGALMCSIDAYDTKVAGVVSGAGGVNPGLCLGQDGVLDGETPVAMTGRVYVKCSTESGAIRPGDRLTTAGLAGHAMKATDSARADGAVIGKAMSSLDEETGLVLVLVNLQ